MDKSCFRQVIHKQLSCYLSDQSVQGLKILPGHSLKSLPNDKILDMTKLTVIDSNLDMTKLKVFADDKINVAKMMISVFARVENIVGKGENAGYQHFLLFPQCFQKASFLGSLKVGIVW